MNRWPRSVSEKFVSEARLLDPYTGQALETNLDGDVLTLTLPGARGVVLWLAR